MTDTSFSSASLRIQRGRNPSSSGGGLSYGGGGGSLSRSSAPYNYHHEDSGSLRLPPAAASRDQQQHGLRSVSSRFSLSEHFAATRSLYEFGFDDASSYAAPSIMGAEDAAAATGGGGGVAVGGGIPLDDDDDDEHALARHEVEELLEGDHYDVLCLPREGELTREAVRRAYHRMFLLFYPETYPAAMQGIARRQFERAQEGFEVLVDEGRRRRHGVGVDDVGDGEAEEEMMRTRTTSEVGVRVDARRDPRRCSHSACRPLDFTVGHSTSIALSSSSSPLTLPALGLTTTRPALTLTSSIYGIIPPLAALPMHTLASPHQPLHPATSPRHRLLQLVESKLCPVIAVRLSHDISSQRGEDEHFKGRERRWLGTYASYGLDILPELAPSASFFHRLNLLPTTATSSMSTTTLPPPPPPITILETSIRGSSLMRAAHGEDAPPRAAIGVQHPLSDSVTAFAKVDSGDWTLTPETYKFLASAHVAEARELRYAEFPMSIAPTVEVGVTSAASSSDGWDRLSWTDAPGAAAGHEPLATSSLPCKRRLSGAAGVWTASATIQPLDNLTASLRYTSRPLSSLSSSRLEIDLSASTIHASQLALRHLLPVTSTTNLGLELSVSRLSTHLSLHISRLGQRFSLPLLLPPLEHLRPLTLFLASAVPFAALAAFKFLRQRQENSRKKAHEAPPRAGVSLDTSSPVVQAAIARRREEADHLTGLLAHPIATRQKHHGSQGGLVILSAKLGVAEDDDPKGAGDTVPRINTLDNASSPVTGNSGGVAAFDPDEEVADVTVALAALVDDQTGGLWIPKGVRKGCVPGFWDPAPGREKLLLVRYSWRGREDVVAVRGEAELVLPPR